jgi:hypothetical protein
LNLQTTPTFLRQKREKTRRLARVAAVDLGIPAIIPAGGT